MKNKLSSLLRYLLAQLVFAERMYLAKIKKSVLLSKIAHSYFFSFEPHPLARGMAIGLFWTFMPMPFQMLPAFLFCWFGFANLPVALVCVWISNPLTYLPIFYFEYQIGALLLHPDEKMALTSLEDFAHYYEHIASSAGNIYLIILEGALIVGTTAAVIGYFAALPLSRYVLSRRNRRRQQ